MALLNENPELAEKLDGFTFFRDIVSVSPTTYFAMPSIHSGQYLDPSQPVMTAYKEHIGRNSFLTQMVESGAKSVLVNKVTICPEQVSCMNSSDVILNQKSEKILNWSLLIDISIFRLLPYTLKPFAYNDGKWLFHNKVQVSNPLNYDGFRDNRVMSDFAQSIKIEKAEPQVKFFHMYATHYQYNFGSNCELVIDTGFSMSRALNSARCQLFELVGIIERLKESGVYDSTLIAVVADHGMGYRIPYKNIGSDRIEESKSALSRDQTVPTQVMPHKIKAELTQQQLKNMPSNTDKARPLFMIKTPNSRDRLVVDAYHAVSLMDLPETLCSYTQLCSIDNAHTFNAFDAPTASKRIRLYNDYIYKPDMWKATNLEEIVTKKEIDYSLINKW